MTLFLLPGNKIILFSTITIEMCIRDRLREVGRILKTLREWPKYLESTEEFLNCLYHNFIESSSYAMMFERAPPHREIQDIIDFPTDPECQFEVKKCYNRIMEKIEKQRAKYLKQQPKPIKYQVGEKVLIKNRELPSTIEGIAKKLLLLCVGPYMITKDNGNNTYEIVNPINKKIKGVYNQASIMKFHEDTL